MGKKPHRPVLTTQIGRPRDPMPKLIPLRKWAERHMDPPPALSTLRAWARNGRFDPPAQRIGREYRVLETARYNHTPPATQDHAELSPRAHAILESW